MSRWKKIGFMLLFPCLLVGSHTSHAQVTGASDLLLRDGHHLSIGVRGGVAGYMIDGQFSGGAMATGYGASADLVYGYFITPHWGIRLGMNAIAFTTAYHDKEILSLSSYIDGYYDSKSLHDANFRIHTPSVNEEYLCYYYEVPIQMAYRSNHWYLNAGVKLMLPIKVASTYSYARSSVDYIGSHDLGNYGTFDIDWDNYPAQHGDEVLYSRNGDNLLNPRFVTAAFETGFRAGCTCGHSWVLGLYFDYAINKVGADTDKPLIQATRGGGYSHQPSVLTSSVIDHLRMVEYGMKIQYEFSVIQRHHWIKKKRSAQTPVKTYYNH